MTCKTISSCHPPSWWFEEINIEYSSCSRALTVCELGGYGEWGVQVGLKIERQKDHLSKL